MEEKNEPAHTSKKGQGCGKGRLFVFFFVYIQEDKGILERLCGSEKLK